MGKRSKAAAAEKFLHHWKGTPLIPPAPKPPRLPSRQDLEDAIRMMTTMPDGRPATPHRALIDDTWVDLENDD